MGLEMQVCFPQPSPTREDEAILGTFSPVKTYALLGAVRGWQGSKIYDGMLHIR